MGEEGPMVGGTMDGGQDLCWDDRGLVFCCYAAWRLFVRSDRLVVAPFQGARLAARRLRRRGLWLRAWGGKLYCHYTFAVCGLRSHAGQQ